MNYPIKFNVCPCCSSPRRVIEEEVLAEIAAGKLEIGARIPALVTQSALFNPNSKSALLVRKQISVMVGYYDVCSSCGVLYCIEMQKQSTVVDPQVQKNMPPMGNGKGKN
jgi:hypothetical protein